MVNFEEVAKKSAKTCRKRIRLIPEDCKINPEYLGFISNDEFVSAFREMQELFINILP